EDGTLRQVHLEELPGNATLQAIVNSARGFADPHALARGVTNGMRWTGKVLVDNQPLGTGVLVLPHLFLTAWHVVKGLFSQNAGQWEPDTAAADRLRIEFDDYLFRRRQRTIAQQPLAIGAHQNWCAFFRPCHAEELQQRF